MNRRELIKGFSSFALTPMMFDKTKDHDLEHFVNFCKECKFPLSDNDIEFYKFHLTSIIDSNVETEYPQKTCLILWKALFKNKDSRIFAMKNDPIVKLLQTFFNYTKKDDFFVASIVDKSVYMVSFYKTDGKNLKPCGKVEFYYI